MSSSVESAGFTTPPLFVVNLDLPPEQRWRHIAEHYVDKFQPLLAYIEQVEIREFGGETVGPKFVSFLSAVAARVSQLHTPEYLRKELEGFAQVTAKVGFDFKKLLMLNVGYDLLARCTSAAVHTPTPAFSQSTPANKNKVPFHLRHMDWDSPALRNMIIDVEFQRSGRTLYRVTSWAGFIGVATGMRLPQPAVPDSGYTVSINYRLAGTDISLVKNLVAGVLSAWPITFLLRNTFETETRYEAALEILKSERLMAPVYLTICGPLADQATIITRGREGHGKLHPLKPKKIQSLQRAFGQPPRGPKDSGLCYEFLVQTNIDNWKVDDSDAAIAKWAAGDTLLLSARERRYITIHRFDQVTDKLLPSLAKTTPTGPSTSSSLTSGGTAYTGDSPLTDTLFDVVAVPPVCNEQTNYAVVMSVGCVPPVYVSRAITEPAVYARRGARLKLPPPPPPSLFRRLSTRVNKHQDSLLLIMLLLLLPLLFARFFFASAPRSGDVMDE